MISKLRFTAVILPAFFILMACAHDHPHGPHTHTHDKRGRTITTASPDWSGIWSVEDPAGTPFHIRINKDKTATNDKVSGLGKKGDYGIWAVQGGILYLTWDRGFHDAIFPGEEGYVYQSWGPTQSPDDKPEVTSPATKVR